MSEIARLRCAGTDLGCLLQYFVNGFGPIISVLGVVSKHAFIQSLLPVATQSPLLLPALIGWSASHLAPIGEPYASIAKLATAATEKRASALMKAGQGNDLGVSAQDKIWMMLMLGGIGVSNAMSLQRMLFSVFRF